MARVLTIPQLINRIMGAVGSAIGALESTPINVPEALRILNIEGLPPAKALLRRGGLREARNIKFTLEYVIRDLDLHKPLIDEALEQLRRMQTTLRELTAPGGST